MTARRPAAGVSLVELLVALAGLVAVVAMAVPAVQRARGSAARAACQNNLRQVGLAAQGYHALHGAFPPGVTAAGRPFQQLGWLARLLPHLDQVPLWEQTVAAYQAAPGNPFTRPHTGVQTVVKTFTCPTDGRLTAARTTRLQFYVAHTSYLGVSGVDHDQTGGIYGYSSHVKIADIIDGTSQTLAAGERPPSPDYWYGWWYASTVSGPQAGLTTLGVRERRTDDDPSLATCPPGPYAFRPGRLDEQCDLFHFWSLHPGGANFGFCDGSVRFLPYAADAVLPAMATRAGGEAVAPPD
jgi:prepilin-type processing-associated H-X9-DG protein